MPVLILLIAVAIGAERALEEKEIPFFDPALIGQWEETRSILVSKQKLYMYGVKAPHAPMQLIFSKDGHLVVLGEKDRRTQFRYETMRIGKKTCLRVFESGSEKANRSLYTIRDGYLYLALDLNSASGDKLLRRVPMSLSELLEEDSELFIITKFRPVSASKGPSK
jgi:hypothetical protein